MTTETTQVSIRLSAETLRQINDLQNSWGENRSQVIIRCVERTWTQHTNLKKAIEEANMTESDVTQFPIKDRP